MNVGAVNWHGENWQRKVDKRWVPYEDAVDREIKDASALSREEILHQL